MNLNTLTRAAELLEEDAEAGRQSCRVGGEQWACADCAGKRGGVCKEREASRARAEVALSLRRMAGGNDHAEEWIAVGNLRVSPSTRAAEVAGQPVDISRMPFFMLIAFARRPNRFFSRQQLLDQMVGDKAVGDRVVDVYVRRLRVALEKAGCDHCIATQRSYGYGLVRRVAGLETAGG